MRRLALLLTLLTLAVPAGALAQSSPIAPLPQPAPSEQPTVQTVPSTSSSTGDDGLGTLGQVLIYGSGALLLVGIAWLVVRDARRRAPVEEERVSQPRGTHSPQRHARARAKAKAARAQRKRNRAKR